MADQFVVPLALLPFFSYPLRLGIWFVCLVIFGFGYYTNPTEQSFKRFMNQLPISASQKPLQSCDNNPASSLRTKNKAQQNSLKQGAAHQNSKNPSRTSSASPKLSFLLCTSHYNRYNLLICTLISIDHSNHSVYNFSSNLAAEDGYPQLEWFLGCFNTWISLRRQILPTLKSLFTASSLDHLKLLWNKWALNIPGASPFSATLTDGLLESLQNPSPLSKGRRRKLPKSQKLALRCQTNLHSNNFTGCSPVEDCSTSACSGSEHNFHATQASTPSSPSASSHQPVNTGASVTVSPGNVGIKARSPGLITPHSQRLVPLKLDTHLIPGPASPTNSTTCDSLLTNSDSSSTSTHCHNNTSPSLSSALCLKEDLAQGSTRESCKPSSKCCQPHAKQNLELVSQDLENQLEEFDYRRNQEDMNKKHYQASLKHLNEIKDLKEFKKRNLDEKLSQSKSAHAKLSKQSAKLQEDLVAIQGKCAAIQSRFSKDTQQIKKEAVHMTTAIKHSKAKIEQLSKTSEAKTAKNKELKEKLATRQAKLSHIMELNPWSKPESKPPTKKNSEIQKPVPAPQNCTALSPIPLEETKNLTTEPPRGCAATAHSNSTWPHFQDSFAPLPAENSAIPMSLHNLTQDIYPVDEGWTPDPWSETTQQNKIRETFISLPNLEWSALKDHYPVLRQTLNTFLTHPPFPTSPLRDEFFAYWQEFNHLPCAAGLTSDFASLVCSQTSSPLGAIGQPGSPTRGPTHSSSVGFNPSPFRFPDSSVVIPSSNCGGLLVGPGYKRQENFSRTSSSSSLSQIPGFCSIQSSPVSHYAPIGTPARSNHQRLNELQESSGKSNDDCTFGRLNQDSKAVEADYTHNSGALGMNASSRLIKSSTVGLSGRETFGGLFPTGTIVEETSPGLKKQHSTQSLGGIPPPPPEGRGLNSIFDIAPETDWPSTTRAQKRPLAASPRLNPSAKVFTFSPSKLSPVTRACPTSSIGQQRVRGYSQSTIPSAVASATQLPGQDTAPDFPSESVEAAKLRKSLHRSSWSMVVGLKATTGGASADDTGETSGTGLQPKAEKACVSLESMMMTEPTDGGNLTASPPELASVLLPGHALPAELTKAACAGLFGPIGDCKSRRSGALSPLLPAGLPDSPSLQPALTPCAAPRQIHRSSLGNVKMP